MLDQRFTFYFLFVFFFQIYFMPQTIDGIVSEKMKSKIKAPDIAEWNSGQMHSAMKRQSLYFAHI